MAHEFEHIVTKQVDKVRFVDYCIDLFPVLPTKKSVKKSIKKQELFLNSNVAHTGDWVNQGDRITFFQSDNSIPKPFPMDIPVLFEDEHLLIVNKPSGLVTSGNQHRTLVAVLAHVGKLSNRDDAYKWIRPLHRLDAATSGIVIAGKTHQATRHVMNQFEERTIQKKYHAVVQGSWDDSIDTISLPVDGKKASSEVSVIRKVQSLKNGTLSLLSLKPLTGRTHQLRIHCADSGHPIVGDQLYGKEGDIMKHKGLFLSATELRFIHPMTGKEQTITLPIPQKFISLLDRESRRYKSYHS